VAGGRGAVTTPERGGVERNGRGGFPFKGEWAPRGLGRHSIQRLRGCLGKRKGSLGVLTEGHRGFS